MGQFFSWFRGSQDTPTLQDVAVDQQSQAKQSTPSPAAPVTTVKPAEYEKGAALPSTAGAAAKPATTAAPAVTTFASAVTTAASTAPVSTTATGSAGVSTAAKVSQASSLDTKGGSSKVTTQNPPISPAKAPPVSAGTGAASGIGKAGATEVRAGKPTVDPVKPKDASKDKAQSTVTPSSKPELSNVTSIGAGSTGRKDEALSKQAKVQAEVPPSAPKATVPAPAVDPFDALAGSLPSSEPLAPKASQYTGPEVNESGITSEEAKRCGEREDTLPPGYRKEDMEKKIPAGKPEKPKEVPKPLTDDEALDSLSAGFVSSAAPCASKSQVTPPISSAKAPPVNTGSGSVSGTGGAGSGFGAGKPQTDPIKLKEAPTDKAQVQKEVPPPAVKPLVQAPPPSAPKATVPAPAVDPFDALAGSLPSSEPLAPKASQYTGPEVNEPGLIAAVANRCGDREYTLPPGYRKEDMEKKSPAKMPEKPKEVSKPLSVDAALDSLSAEFGSSAVPSAPKSEVKAESRATAHSSFAPPPPAQKRQEVSAPSSISPAPPADKKAKVEKGDTMPLDDALSALEDTLPTAKPVPESPKLKPEDIVNEKPATSEKGVRVGEREDSLPPDYRFSEEKLKEKPAPPKQPSMDSAEALDILCGDFTSPTVASAVQAPVPPSAPGKQQPKVEDLSALDALAGDFMAPVEAQKVATVATPAAKSTLATSRDEGEPMSLDALSALEGTLPSADPVPESPKLRPEDIIDEKKLTSKKGVLVGEREDTLPPNYRFSEEELKKYPAQPKREPSLDSAAALDILSGDFTSPSAAPAVKAPVPPSAPPAESSGDLALEKLAGDFVAPRAASKVQSAVVAPPKPERQLSEATTSAMDALSDTLMDIAPTPEPEPVSPKNIVKEKKVVEERVTKAGEKDDSLPPDYRPTEADIKAAAEAKAKAKANVPPKQTSMDESAALDVLSSDFSTPAVAAPAAPVAPPSSKSQASPAQTTPTLSTSTASGPVLDKLASTLLPDFPETKPKESKQKVKGGKSKSKSKKPAVHDVQATGDLSVQPSTDVVSTAPTKKGGKS